jgi:hypothetical protein
MKKREKANNRKSKREGGELMECTQAKPQQKTERGETQG